MAKSTGVAKEQRRALGRLKTVPGLEGFYLAGGTAVAVHLRPRETSTWGNRSAHLPSRARPPYPRSS